jgi:predicted permease
MPSTSALLQALLPVILLIGLGVALKRRAFLAETFWAQAERLCYFILLPALFFHSLATARLGELPIRALALTLILSTLVVAALLLAARPLMRIDGKGFTSIFQGGVRFNNYVGVMLVSTMLGAKGTALAALCNAALVPTVNLLSVLVFARFAGAGLSPLGALQQVATNPLVLSCLGGIGFQALGFALPGGLEPTLKALGSAAMPLGLLCVGAALTFGRLGDWARPIAWASLFKLALLPLVTLAVTRALALDPSATTAALLFQSLPTASSAYILARQLGGDAPLMAAIKASQTLLAALTMPAVLAFAGWLGGGWA